MYSVIYHDEALEFLNSLESPARERIFKKIESIKANPFRFIEHYETKDVYKMRIGDYRAMIDVDFADRILKILFIEHRKKVYKRFQI